MEEEKNESPFGVAQEVQSEAVQQPEPIIQTMETMSQPVLAQEQVSEQLEYAGFWVRFSAMFVDGLVLIIPSIIVAAIFGKNLGTFLQYVLMWGYSIYMLTTRQATLGKMAVGIKVVSINGDNQTTGKLALREIVGKILNMITLGIGYIMIAFTEKKQGLHDMIADTVVVYDQSGKRRPWLVGLCVAIACIIPVLMIIGIFLVSTNNAKQKALDSANAARQKAASENVK